MALPLVNDQKGSRFHEWANRAGALLAFAAADFSAYIARQANQYKDGHVDLLSTSTWLCIKSQIAR